MTTALSAPTELHPRVIDRPEDADIRQVPLEKEWPVTGRERVVRAYAKNGVIAVVIELRPGVYRTAYEAKGFVPDSLYGSLTDFAAYTDDDYDDALNTALDVAASFVRLGAVMAEGMRRVVERQERAAC